MCAAPVGAWVGGKSQAMNLFCSAALVAGQVVVREATVSNVGEATNPVSTTSVTDMLGIATDATTSVTAATIEPSEITQQNIVRLIVGPFEVYRFKIAGGTTSATALGTSSPANILTNSTASAGGTVISSTAVGTISMAGGLIKGRTGNNAGSIRKMISQSNSVSTTVGIAFIVAIAATTDTFTRVPFSRTVQNVQLTTDYVAANGIIATGTGAAFRVTSVIIDEINDIAWVDCVTSRHQYNPNA